MQVSIETMTGLERRLTIGVPAERVDVEVSKRLKDASSGDRQTRFLMGVLCSGLAFWFSDNTHISSSVRLFKIARTRCRNANKR